MTDVDAGDGLIDERRGTAASPPLDVNARIAVASQRAEAALARFASAPDALDDPLVVVPMTRARQNGNEPDPRPLLDQLASREPHYGRTNPHRYRWGLSWRSDASHTLYRRSPGCPPAHWRPAEHKSLVGDPSAYGRRLMEPITIAAHLRYWGELAAREPDSEAGALAANILTEALPTIEHDVASWFQASDPWRDTFGLWLLTGEPQTVTRLRDLLFALAIRYGALAARRGSVEGIKHPFFERPLVSASAHLANGLWRTGVYPSVVPSLVQLVGRARQADGGWGDEGQPTDVLTTLAAADVLARLDPDFAPGPTVDWFLDHQEPAGWWRALGPEVPWLTAAIVDWLNMSARPFPERFEWPSAPVWARDRLTGLTTNATFDELGVVLAGLPALGAQEMEAAFVDLAGFGPWNNRHGQSRGDELMGVLGRALIALPDVLPVRIGGDEFLVLAKPGATGLTNTLDPFRAEWPGIIAAAGMGEAVPMRIVVGRVPAGDIQTLRRALGEAIGRLKHDVPVPPPEGILLDL